MEIANSQNTKGAAPAATNAAAPAPVGLPTGVKTGKSELLDAGRILRDMISLKPGQRVSDFGAGGGLFTMEAARIVGPQGQIYAVDIMKNVLAEIDSKARMAGLTNIKTIWSNVEILGATKIPAQTVDLVIMVNILFQSDKHYDVMAEAVRLLKSSGHLLVVDWSDTRPGFAPQSARQVDRQEIIDHANSLDLNLVQDFKAGNYHFGLVFAKN